MLKYVSLLYCLLVCFAAGDDQCNDGFLEGNFPDDFGWGSATSSYQIEGGWNASDKGLSIWDTFVHEGGNIKNNDTGDVACDSYHKSDVDVQNLVALGVNRYRFSISWPRVLPQGTPDVVSEDGVQYYKNLLDMLVSNNIQPQVTLYHWDLPQTLEDRGGWLSEDIITWYKDYADFCFKTFGDKAKFWITFNEPWIVAFMGYGMGSFAPGIFSKEGKNSYEVGHIIIKAHAEAWHLYNDNYRATQQGQIGITLNLNWAEPGSDKQVDIDAASRSMEFDMGWFANPIYNNGDYPEVMKLRVAQRSEEQGLSSSRLPEFTEKEKQRIKGTGDFFGLNFYTGSFAEDATKPWGPNMLPGIIDDKAVKAFNDPSWESSGSPFMKVTPFFIRYTLRYITRRYQNPPIYVTENGFSDLTGQLNDERRVCFYRNYINEVLKAIKLDNSDVRAYTAWSFMDNFEWTSGYHDKFGLMSVDFEDDSRPRTPKDSFKYFTGLISSNGFSTPEITVDGTIIECCTVPYPTTPTQMQTDEGKEEL